MRCEKCKGYGKGKIFLKDNYYHAICRRCECTFKKKFPNGHQYDGYKICVLYTSIGYVAWVNEGSADGFAGSHTHTQIFKTGEEAFNQAKLLLSDHKNRQLDLFTRYAK